MREQELTWKQKVFCKNYIANGFNATQAALVAGYTKVAARQVASDTLSKTYVQAYIEKLMEESSKKLEITYEWKLEKLKKAVDRSIKDEDIPPSDGYGIKDGLNAISELNKMQGHYAKADNHNDEKVEEEIKSTVNEYEKDH